MGALSFLLTYLPQVPSYVAGGIAIADAISIGMDKAKQLRDEDREVTEDDWNQVNASIAAKRTRLHAPGS